MNKLGVWVAALAATVVSFTGSVFAAETITEQAAALQPGEWLAAPLTGQASDIVTLGEPVTYTTGNEVYTNAYAAGGNFMTEAGHVSVGGIAFANGSYKNLKASGRAVTDNDCTYFGTSGTSGDYARLMGAAFYTDDNFSQITFNIANKSLQGEYPALEVGAKYMVQLFFHSGRTSNDEYLGKVSVDEDSTKTVQYGAVQAGDDWYYGGTLVHVFTATETSYSFKLNYSARYAIYNAFQLRKLPESDDPSASTINELAKELEEGEWLVTPMTGEPSDIVTNGTLVLTSSLRGDMLADSPYGITGDESVAGLSFHAFSDLFSNTTTQLKNGNFNGRVNSYGNCGHTDDAYGQLMNEGWYGNNAVVAEFTYIGLQAGQTYLLQGFIHDGRDGRTGYKAKIDGKDLQYGDVEGGTWYYGGTFVHVFTPTGSTYKFTIDYTQGATQINAVQLRKVTLGVDPLAGKTVRERAAKLHPGEWLAMPMQGAATDIVIEGEVNSYDYNMQTHGMAYAKGTYSGDETVGGVKFRDAKDRLAITPSISKNADGLGNCGMTGDYATLLSKAWNADTSESGYDFTYSELEVGQTYLVQIVLHNGKSSTSWMYADDYATTAVITDGAGTAHLVECGAFNTDDRWYYGGTFLHVFTATETTYSFNLKFYKNDTETVGGLLNAIQLRKVERAPETIAEKAAELTAADGWLGLPMTGEASDFAVKGELVFAYSATAANDASVANIPFVKPEGWSSFDVGSIGVHANYPWYCVTDKGSVGYGNILGDGYWYDGDRNKDYPFVVKGLTVGETYLVQMFIHNGRGTDSEFATGYTDEYRGTASVDGGQVQVQYGAPKLGDEWCYGGTLIKAFTADEEGKFAFNVHYGSMAPQWNAVQVRHLTSGDDPEEPDEPVEPSIGAVSASVLGTSATITLADIVFGTDETGATEATDYTAYLTYALADGDPVTMTLAAQTAATCAFALTDLAGGNYTYSVVITNSEEIGSAPKNGSFKIKNTDPSATIAAQAAKLLESQGWLAAPMTGDAGDFVTEGYVITNYWNNYTISSIFAYSCNNDIEPNDPSVAGIPWHRPDSRALEFEPGWLGSAEPYYYDFNGKQDNRDSVMTGYQRLLTGGWDGNQSHYTLTIKDLEPHATYVVQIIIHSNRGYSRGEGSPLFNLYDQYTFDQFRHTAVIGGESIQYGDVDEDGEWWYGGTFVKVFSANRYGKFSFDIDYPDGMALYNAIQVRKIDRSTPSADPVDPVAPQLGSATVDVVDSQVVIAFAGLNRGSDASGLMAESVDVYLAYSPAGTELPEAKLVATSSESTATALLTKLAPGVYDFSAYAKNACGESTPIVGTFTIPQEADPATEKPILVISEIGASNPDSKDDGGFATKNGRYGLDWVEIYNGSDIDIDITGWYLFDDPTKAVSKWKRIEGDCIVPAKGYKVVWCDKDYADFAMDEAYSRIGLSTSGETVFLAAPDGTILDSVAMPSQVKGISYGLGKLQGSDEIQHVYFSTPTPGAANAEFGAGPMTPKVEFSVPHGYKTEVFNVEITCPDDPGADIYYTTDGTSPTTASTKYTEAIPITKTTVLRAAVPRADSVLQQDTSATYIFLADVLTAGIDDLPTGFPTELDQNGQFHGQSFRYGMSQSLLSDPEARERILRGFTNSVQTISLVIDPAHMFSEDKGIYVNANMKYDWATSPDDEWERPMMIEQIDPVNGVQNEFTAPAGIRIRGAGSRGGGHAKHSFKVYFRSAYGMGKLAFPLFGDEGADEFDRFDLRCSQNHSWANENSTSDTFIHEVFSRDSQRDMGEYYTRSRYYNLFINGVYWGLYQTQERGDENFAETYNGGSADNYDMVRTSYRQGGYNTEVSGSDAAWNKLIEFDQQGFAGEHFDNYLKILGKNPDGTRNPEYPCYLNPTNLMVYMISSHYACDSDCPAAPSLPNNLYLLRDRVDGNAKKDGFFLLRHDAEHSLGVREPTEILENDQATMYSQYYMDTTGFGTEDAAPFKPRSGTEHWNNGVGFNPAELHWELCKNSIYCRAFGDQFYKHCLRPGGAMTEEQALARFRSRMHEIDDVIVCEAARWSMDLTHPKTHEDWLTGCGYCIDFITNRMPYMVSQYRNRGWYPSIDTPEPDIWDGPVAEGATVTFSMNPTNTYDQVYVTTDGSDPADSATAVPGLTLTIPSGVSTLTVKARAKQGDEWSALQELEYTVFVSESDGYTFYFTGDYDGDQTVAPTGTECVVIFDGATIDGQFVIPDGVKAFLCPTNGTENSVKGIVGPNSSLTLKDFDGLGGKVSLTGEDTLISISNLVVKSGTLDLTSTGVTATKTPVVNVLGHVKQDGGEINLDLSAVSADPAMQAYGLYVANKDPEDANGKNLEIIYAEFNGGEFNAKVGGWKSAALYINKGSVEATFNEGSTNNVELTGPEARFVNAAGDLNLKGGEFKVVMPGEYSALTNARVFKSDKEIKIKGGHYDVNVPGPGSEIFSAVKDKKDSIITVKDGTFELIADDDCFSADDRIDIQGGLFYAVSLNNDVFDSNGDMLVSGGTIMAYATAAGHEAFDVEPEVQGKEVSSYTHQLTISGGTIFATGGKNAAWPQTVNAGEGVNLYQATEIEASTISEKYASIKGTQPVEGSEDPYVVTTTAKLPAFPGSNGALLMTCPNMTAGATPTYSDEAPAKGDQQFHYLYVSSNLKSNQEYVRIYEVYGSTNDGDSGDTGEYLVLTNVSDKVVQLTGLTVTSAKYDKKNNKIDTPKVNITFTEGTLAAGASIKLLQDDFTGKGWEKVTNGTIYFEIIDDEGTVVQCGFGAFDNELFPHTDGEGAAIRAKRFDNDEPLAATTEDWESTAPAPTEDPDAPVIGGDEISDPIVVTSDKVTIKISNAAVGHRYGYLKSTTLEGLATAEPVWLYETVDAAGLLSFEIAKDPAEPTCFYKIIVE